eukprot:829021-Pelagomonas_calceolata.AAC.4
MIEGCPQSWKGSCPALIPLNTPPQNVIETPCCLTDCLVGKAFSYKLFSHASLLQPNSLGTPHLQGFRSAVANVAGLHVPHLQHSASIGEAATWRHQRLNAATAAFAAIALTSQLYALPASSPVLSGWVKLALCLLLTF